MSIYLDEFETLYGISSNIQELKHKIFDLAFEGKLTEQDYSEEEVNSLSNNIKNERNRLIKEKIITKPRGGLEEINNDEKTKSIPDNWKWLKLGEVVYMLTNRKKENGKLPYIVVKVLRGTKDPKIKNKGQIVNKGDYVILVDGENSGEVFTVNQEGYLGSTLRRLKFNKYVNKKYLLLFLKKQHIFLKNRKKGAAIPHLNKTIFRNINFPLPPFEEQKRIVDKIEKLIKEVDKLEEKLEKKEDISQNLSESIVEAIKNSQDAQELKEKLRFIIDNFDVIFKTSESMDEMKNIVLQLAIEGKLVSQNENDEPASELIDKIKRKREELVKKGESRNINKKINEINKDELPFDIPDNWSWVRLGNLTKQITDGTHQTPNYIEEGVPFLSVKNISQGYLDKDDIKYISKEEHLELIKRCKPEKGDILFCRIGTLGKALKLRDNFEFSIFVSLGLLKFVDNSLGDYLEKFLNSPEFYRQIEIVKVGGSHTNKINLRDVPNFLIPIPPLEEQKIIVNKVNSIMSIIDKLEKELIKKEDLVEKLGSI